MKSDMVECKVNIIEAFDLDSYPGWCKAVIKDNNGTEHILVDKLPLIGMDVDEVSRAEELKNETYYRSPINC